MTSTRIIIEAVPPDKMRLEAYHEAGCGDWFWDRTSGDLHIRVAATDVWDEPEAWLVAIHELIEARLCFNDGVTEGAVDAFDAAFKGDGEPGDDAAAPYRRQHRFACLIEHLIARELGIENYGTVT